MNLEQIPVGKPFKLISYHSNIHGHLESSWDGPLMKTENCDFVDVESGRIAYRKSCVLKEMSDFNVVFKDGSLAEHIITVPTALPKESLTFDSLGDGYFVATLNDKRELFCKIGNSCNLVRNPSWLWNTFEQDMSWIDEADAKPVEVTFSFKE